MLIWGFFWWVSEFFKSFGGVDRSDWVRDGIIGGSGVRLHVQAVVDRRFRRRQEQSSSQIHF